MIETLRSERGLSLIQVMIAIVITSMMGLFVMQMVLQMRKVEILMNLQSEVKDVERQVQRVLMDPVACFTTIQPIVTMKKTDIPVHTQDIIQSIYGPPYQNSASPGQPLKIFYKGQDFANKQLTLNMINVVWKRSDYDPDIPFPAPGVVTLYLELNFKKTSDSGLGGDFIKRFVPISVHTNKLGQIAECSAVDKTDLVQEMCTALDLTFDPVAKNCLLFNHPNVDKVVKAACSALGLGSNGTSCQ